MKKERHIKILSLIEKNAIDTQEELMNKLRESGFEVTQATVSRDIKELRLVKILSEGGGYKYAAPDKEESAMENKYRAILRQSVRDVDSAGNIVVVKCYNGMANAACAAVDSIHTAGIVGTLAGDDTIFVLLKTEEAALQFAKEFKNYYA